MKAEIIKMFWWYRWRIKAKNGVILASSQAYTRRDNAIRGLKEFIYKITVSPIEFNGVIL